MPDDAPADQGRGRARRRRRDRVRGHRRRGPRRARARARRSATASCSCPRSTTRASWPARAPSGLEIVEQLGGARAHPAEPLARRCCVPIGGGGLSAGIASAVKALRPDATVVGRGARAGGRCGRLAAAGPHRALGPGADGRTIADGARTSALGRIPFAHLRRLLDGVVTVSEDDIRLGHARGSHAGPHRRRADRRARHRRLVPTPGGVGQQRPTSSWSSAAATSMRRLSPVASARLLALSSGGDA